MTDTERRTIPGLNEEEVKNIMRHVIGENRFFPKNKAIFQ